MRNFLSGEHVRMSADELLVQLPRDRADVVRALLAAQLRVSTMTVYRLIKAGQLASVRVGKSYRVREDDVDRYLGSTYTQAG